MCTYASNGLEEIIVGKGSEALKSVRIAGAWAVGNHGVVHPLSL